VAFSRRGKVNEERIDEKNEPANDWSEKCPVSAAWIITRLDT